MNHSLGMKHHFRRDSYFVLSAGKIVLVLFLVVILQLNHYVKFSYCESGDDVSSASGSALSPITSANCDENDIDPRHKLYLVAMAPFPDPVPALNPPFFNPGPSLAAAVELALDQINRRDDILPDYKLCMIEADSGCMIETKLSISIVKDVYNLQKQVVGIIGPACSGPALLLAPLIARRNVNIISITPSAISPRLSNPNYTNTFATVSTSLFYVESFRALIKHQKWNNVAALYNEGVFFKSTFEKFFEEMRDKVSYSSVIYDDNNTPSFPLKELRESQSRVIFAFVSSISAARLLCYALNLNMVYPIYQWIFNEQVLDVATGATGPFTIDGTVYNCTDKDMLAVAHGVIFNEYDLKQSGTIDVTGLNYSEYFSEYETAFSNYLSRMGVSEEDKSKHQITIWASPYYDATWAMALALHNASHSGVDLSTYTRNQPEQTEIIRRQLFDLRFEGSSGPVFFNEGSRATNTVIDITQLWVHGNTIQNSFLGRFSRNTLNLADNASEFIIGSDKFDIKEARVHIGASILVMMVLIILVTVTVLLQIAFLKWSRYKSIKATSPNISHLIFSGCYLFSIAVFIITIQETFSYPGHIHPVIYALFCNISTWCMVLGYSLIFGTVLAKSWRIYRLFKHFRSDSPGILIKDNALCLFVIILLIVDTAVMVTWNMIDPWLQEKYNERVINKSSAIPVIKFDSRCECEHVFVWIGVIVGYKGLMASALVVFSILNRKIRRKGFRHSKKINILIYILTLFIGVSMPLYFLTRHIDIHIGYVILCFILNLTVFMCCLMLFIPPVLPVVKNKLGLKEDARLHVELHRRLSEKVSRSSFSGGDLFIGKLKD